MLQIGVIGKKDTKKKIKLIIREMPYDLLFCVYDSEVLSGKSVDLLDPISKGVLMSRLAVNIEIDEGGVVTSTTEKTTIDEVKDSEVTTVDPVTVDSNAQIITGKAVVNGTYSVVDGYKVFVANIGERTPIINFASKLEMFNAITAQMPIDVVEITELPPALMVTHIIGENGVKGKYAGHYGNLGNFQFYPTKSKDVRDDVKKNWDYITMGSDVTYEGKKYVTFNPGFLTMKSAVKWYIEKMYSSSRKFWMSFVVGIANFAEFSQPIAESFIMDLYAKGYFTGTPENPADKYAKNREIDYKRLTSGRAADEYEIMIVWLNKLSMYFKELPKFSNEVLIIDGALSNLLNKKDLFIAAYN